MAGNPLIEKVHRPILAKVLAEAGYDPALAASATFVPVETRKMDISFDLGGEVPVAVYRFDGVEKREGWRWAALMASPDPRRRKRGWRLFRRILGGFR